MSSDPKSIQDTLHDAVEFPGDFNPVIGKWETANRRASEGPRMTLVFDTKTKKLLALTPEQAAVRKEDEHVSILLAQAGYFNLF